MKLHQLDRGTKFTLAGDKEVYYFIKCDGMYAQVCRLQHIKTQAEDEVAFIGCSTEVTPQK